MNLIESHELRQSLFDMSAENNCELPACRETQSFNEQTVAVEPSQHTQVAHSGCYFTCCSQCLRCFDYKLLFFLFKMNISLQGRLG